MRKSKERPTFHAYVGPGAAELIGTWWPPGCPPAAGTLHVAADASTAERWRAALLEGRCPHA